MNKNEKQNRFFLDGEFRKYILRLAQEQGTSADTARKLGYKGKWAGKRFNELKNGVIQSFSEYQLNALAKMTNVPLSEIQKHILFSSSHES